jgi:4,5-DOPA dioxygenase extradiol
MPSLFFAHGAPTLATDQQRGAQLAQLAAALPAKPRGIVAFTPHVRGETLSMAAHGEALRSFPARFAPQLGSLRYTPPPATALADELRALLSGSRHELSAEDHVAYNHTVWMGLVHLFPAADVPVLEVAMPFVAAPRLFEIGRLLAPLRKAGVLIVSSGALTHNLASMGTLPTPQWAFEFDAWLAQSLDDGAIDTLLDWRHRAPAAALAHPDDGGHFNVLMFALGAACADGARLRAQSFHQGFEMGTFSTRDYLLA